MNTEWSCRSNSYHWTCSYFETFVCLSFKCSFNDVYDPYIFPQCLHYIILYLLHAHDLSPEIYDESYDDHNSTYDHYLTPPTLTSPKPVPFTTVHSTLNSTSRTTADHSSRENHHEVPQAGQFMFLNLKRGTHEARITEILEYL